MWRARASDPWVVHCRYFSLCTLTGLQRISESFKGNCFFDWIPHACLFVIARVLRGGHIGDHHIAMLIQVKLHSIRLSDQLSLMRLSQHINHSFGYGVFNRPKPVSLIKPWFQWVSESRGPDEFDGVSLVGLTLPAGQLALGNVIELCLTERMKHYHFIDPADELVAFEETFELRVDHFSEEHIGVVVQLG